MGHPNIIETHPLINIAGERFLAEEFLPVVLGDHWEAGGVQEAANLLHEVCKALHYLHSELGLSARNSRSRTSQRPPSQAQS